MTTVYGDPAADAQPAVAATTDTGAANTADAHSNTNSEALSSRLNWLRAGVLGANDGIVSTAALVLGVAGAIARNIAGGLAAMAVTFGLGLLVGAWL